MLTVEIYQSVSPELGEPLQKKEILPTLLAACEQLIDQKSQLGSYDKETVRERFVHLSQLVSLERQMIVSLDSGQRLAWQQVLVKLAENYPQLVWTQLREDLNEEQTSVYYFNFIPVAFRQAEFPFTVSLLEALKQQLSPLTVDVLQEFKKEIGVLLEEHLLSTNQNLETALTNDRQINSTRELDPASDNRELILYREELSKEKNAKERMKLANKKLELMMEQMEKQVIGSAVAYLTKANKQAGKEDWHKVLKIDLREYSQLFQKAKYLERSWLINQSLETKSEKMTISDQAMTYEREQVRKLKDVSHSEELFFMIDECDMIAKRAKVKEHPFFGKPFVRLMKMDYEVLMEKAAYFDLIQGENYLLERMVQEQHIEAPILEGAV